MSLFSFADRSTAQPTSAPLTGGLQPVETISFNDFHPGPGRVVEWAVGPHTANLALSAPADPVPLSYNQQLHLGSARAAALAGLPSNPWIGATFDVDGPADLAALENTFTMWVRRHDALRSGFREGAAGIERFTLSPEEIDLVRGSDRGFDSPEEMHAHLDRRFVTGTDPFAWPPLVLGVISRSARSTVFVVMDHVCGDGYSLALAVSELRSIYEAVSRDKQPVLPETGSFLEHAREERAHGQGLDPDDPAIGHWRDFVRACGGTTPAFPLHLGVEPGQTWPQSFYNRVLLSADEAARFEEVCQEAGSTFFAGLLAAMGIAVREITGDEEFRTITPVHTRYKHRWRAAMGWFITVAPLDFSLAGASSFAGVLPRAHVTVRDALRLSHYPAARVIELLGDDFRVTRRDLFSMVSYTDYRTMHHVDGPTDWNPVTIGEVSVADDCHVWVSRVHDGVRIGIRHPDTPTANEMLDEYTATIEVVMGRVADARDYPLAPAWACQPMPGPL
jgi:hypothetical protein